MVIEAKCKEMERFMRMKVYRVVTRDPMERDEEGKMNSIRWVITNKGTEELPNANVRLVAREFNTRDKRGELFAGTPGPMAMRTVISRAMTKCQNEPQNQLCWPMSRQPFCTATQGGHCMLSSQHLVETSASLTVPCMELATPR